MTRDVKRLRDVVAARLWIADHRLTQKTLRNLLCRQVTQNAQGMLLITLRDGATETKIRLSRDVGSPLLEYLESIRGWGRRQPLFPCPQGGKVSLKTIGRAVKAGRELAWPQSA